MESAEPYTREETPLPVVRRFLVIARADQTDIRFSLRPLSPIVEHCVFARTGVIAAEWSSEEKLESLRSNLYRGRATRVGKEFEVET